MGEKDRVMPQETEMVTLLAQEDAKAWLSQLGSEKGTDQELLSDISESLENSTYKNAIESEILSRNASPSILKDFHLQISNFLADKKLLEETKGRLYEELTLTRIKPNSQSIVINP
jgi:hypothetical protein